MAQVFLNFALIEGKFGKSCHTGLAKSKFTLNTKYSVFRFLYLITAVT